MKSHITFLPEQAYWKIQFFLFLFILFTGSAFSQIKTIENKGYKVDDLLTCFDGQKVKNILDWEKKRRPEILKYYEENIYGKRPDFRPEIRYEVKILDTISIEGNRAIHKEIQITFYWQGDSLLSNVSIFLPFQKLRPPLFLGLNFYGNQTISMDSSILLTNSYVENSATIGITQNKASNESRGKRAYRWPLGLILKNGYGLATAYYGDFDPDYDDGFKNGIHGLENGKKPESKPNDWAAISAWAWGLSQIQTYFENDADLNQSKVIVMGHSRLGKAALWAGALDSRFDMVISNNSGCGGATQFKRKAGEDIEAINRKFPHWFCKNFKAFANKEDSLLLDQQMLISLMAPRPVYVASAELDQNADPEGEYISLCLSQSIYQLYQPTLSFPYKRPKINEAFHLKPMGYHIRSGKHEILEQDWQCFIKAADSFLGKE
jgi:hypothetical protein